MVFFEILSPSSQQLCIDNPYAFSFEPNEARLPQRHKSRLKTDQLPSNFEGVLLSRGLIYQESSGWKVCSRELDMFVGGQAKLVFSLDLSSALKSQACLI